MLQCLRKIRQKLPPKEVELPPPCDLAKYPPFEFEWVGKEIELDDEESGTSSSLGLSRAQQRLLRRTGDVDRD